MLYFLFPFSFKFMQKLEKMGPRAYYFAQHTNVIAFVSLLFNTIPLKTFNSQMHSIRSPSAIYLYTVHCTFSKHLIYWYRWLHQSEKYFHSQMFLPLESKNGKQMFKNWLSKHIQSICINFVRDYRLINE